MTSQIALLHYYGLHHWMVSQVETLCASSYEGSISCGSWRGLILLHLQCKRENQHWHLMCSCRPWEREREREKLIEEVFGAAGRAAPGGVVVKLVVQHHNKAPVRTEYWWGWRTRLFLHPHCALLSFLLLSLKSPLLYSHISSSFLIPLTFPYCFSSFPSPALTFCSFFTSLFPLRCPSCIYFFLPLHSFFSHYPLIHPIISLAVSLSLRSSSRWLNGSMAVG